MKKIILDIRKELKKNIDFRYKESCKRYYRGDQNIKFYGVRTPVVRKIALNYFRKIKVKEKKEILFLCEEFLKSGYNEEATIAFQWASGLNKDFAENDFLLFEKWLKKYVDNWSKCDDFCSRIVHYFLEDYPKVVLKVKAWTLSPNRWVRRASAVSFITSDGPFYVVKYDLKDIFWVAQKLLLDKDDLVQKGYGWMLKSASIYHPKEVFQFVMRHKNKMPRTALRYAIEKLPKKLKNKAMQK